MSKLVLIDSMAILHRAFHALPPLTTKKGEPIGAIYGLVSMLLKIIQDLKPTHLALVFDEKEKTFRQKEFKEYQAQRPAVMSELSTQFVKARDFAKVAGIPAYSKAGYEADDVIGTLSTKATETTNEKHDPPSTIHHSPFDEIIIVTGDRDILQLVDDKKNVKLYMPVLGLSNARLFGEKETEERMGVSPKLIPDYKGLVGDASDNYKGVPGIGPKTAISLLTKYKSMKGVYDHLDELPKPAQDKLKAGKKDAEMSYHLATIVKDVPVEFNFDEMNKWRIDSDAVLNLFENEYGFKTLTKRVKEVGKQIVSEDQGKLF